ncbi:NACHT, LRR and PYD domains-containing protein 1-like [Thalassophryne amazonica]|uniref:NACHT, LRR and PYD domains-containing protein 1-like n=1 Tax=Thalassophryne amazonica TaxID=390379 RepID=UPI001472434E|nr:NACHT, LRR and PYD domains-containing protein 1-like [Thalassophryne amazonica]
MTISIPPDFTRLSLSGSCKRSCGYDADSTFHDDVHKKKRKTSISADPELPHENNLPHLSQETTRTHSPSASSPSVIPGSSSVQDSGSLFTLKTGCSPNVVFSQTVHHPHVICGLAEDLSSENPVPAVTTSEPGEELESLEDIETPVKLYILPAYSPPPPPESSSSISNTSFLPRSHSMSSLSPDTSAEDKNMSPATSLPEMVFEERFEEFDPDITDDEDGDTYRLWCPGPGLYWCSVTHLVFNMEGGGDVTYRVVPWNRRLLAQYYKKCAGPLFDIQSLHQTVCQLHLPHCQIGSTANSLSVAHVTDDGIKFIAPRRITETHVIININGFSAYGNVKDNSSPPDPVRALVLLFYAPPLDPELRSVLNVLLLSRNVMLRDVLQIRKRLVGDEQYIETLPHCKLKPKQEYTLFTCPEDNSVQVTPAEAEFDEESYDSYFPSFLVILETLIKDMTLFLRDAADSSCVWQSPVCLLSTSVRKPSGLNVLNLPEKKKLLEIRSNVIDGVSEPVLKSLLDKLLEKKVISDSEKDSVDGNRNKTGKPRFVIDTVRMKSEAASSQMIEFLCELDPFLCEHLGLM